MSIARVTEISSTSKKSFEDAIQSGVTRATETLRNVRQCSGADGKGVEGEHQFNREIGS